MIYVMSGGSIGGFPKFTYTGTYTLIDDGDKNWRVKFLTSGTLVFTSLSGNIDVFILGGGGGGNKYTYNDEGAGGGGGGYTHTSIVPSVIENTSYPIVVGAGGVFQTDGTTMSDGGNSSAFGLTANGGKGGIYHNGGNGGSGGGGGKTGIGGTDGSNGTAGSWSGGLGQGTTTREFAEASGTLYATGGNGRSGATSGTHKTANTGDGGDGTVSGNPTSGAPGIVIIRNHRAA